MDFCECKINFCEICEHNFANFSISGPSATIYAYLGEFHCLKYRSKAMMLGKLIKVIAILMY